MGSKSAGSAEKMYDEILTLYEGMKRDKVNVRLRVVSPIQNNPKTEMVGELKAKL